MLSRMVLVKKKTRASPHRETLVFIYVSYVFSAPDPEKLHY